VTDGRTDKVRTIALFSKGKFAKKLYSDPEGVFQKLSTRYLGQKRQNTLTIFQLTLWRQNTKLSTRAGSEKKKPTVCIRAREEFYIQNPQSRIDELLFQEPTTKISASNSKYNCFFAQ
jgi:hypothetical protein